MKKGILRVDRNKRAMKIKRLKLIWKLITLENKINGSDCLSVSGSAHTHAHTQGHCEHSCDSLPSIHPSKSSVGWPVVFQCAIDFSPRVTGEHSYISLSLKQESQTPLSESSANHKLHPARILSRRASMPADWLKHTAAGSCNVGHCRVIFSELCGSRVFTSPHVSSALFSEMNHDPFVRSEHFWKIWTVREDLANVSVKMCHLSQKVCVVFVCAFSLGV